MPEPTKNQEPAVRKAEEYEIIRRQIQELYQELEKEKEESLLLLAD